MKLVALKEIVDINPRYKENGTATEKVTFIPMAGVSEDGHLHASEERDFAEVRKGYTYFEEGDVLLAKITPCMENGKAAIACDLPHPVGFGSTEFHVLRAGSEVERDYLFYAVWNQGFRRIAAKNMTGSAGQKRVPASFLKDYKIPLPPLEEQKRIAAILDKADALRRKRAQALQLTDQFLQSLFLDMFGDPVTNPKGWETKAVDEFAKVQGGLQVSHRRSVNPIEVPYLRVANVYRGVLDLSEIKTIRVTESELERIRLTDGDVLVVEGHGNRDEIGRAAIWDGSIEDCIHQNHLIRVRLNPQLIAPQYFCHFVNSPGGRRQMLGFGKTTSGLNTISTRQVKSLDVLMPPMELQDEFLKVLAKARKTTEKLTASDRELNILSGSLTAHAFRGDL